MELPEYSTLVNAVLKSPSAPGFGTEHSAFLDALFFLGLYTLHEKPSIFPNSDQEFNDALQRLSLLSAQLPSPTQRYQAHQITSSLLHLHPSQEVKVDYIKDTLEHCPYENLKASAVLWLKDEILAANSNSGQGGEAGGVFSNPDILESIGEFLWGDRVGVPIYSPQQSREEQMEQFSNLQNMLPFYLGVLNLLFLLLHNSTLYERLGVADFIDDIRSEFLPQLLDTATGFEESFGAEEAGDEEEKELLAARIAELQLLSMNCHQVIDRISERGKG